MNKVNGIKIIKHIKYKCMLYILNKLTYKYKTFFIKYFHKLIKFTLIIIGV